MTTYTTSDWTTDTGATITTSGGADIEFRTILTDIHPQILHAQLLDRELNAPEVQIGTVATSGGLYPNELTAQLIDRDLTAPEVDGDA